MNLAQTGPETVQVGCTLTLDVTAPAGVVLQIAPARPAGGDLSERLDIVNNTVPVTASEIAGPVGGRAHLIRVQPGKLTVDYRATVTTGGGTTDRVGDAARVEALRPSRYCPSDRLAGFAQSHFGDLPTAGQRVRAITDYVWRHIAYVSGSSGPTTDALDTLLSGQGVCRDFAHLVAALCRAVDVPARIAAVYAPGLSPMDFHAVVETDIDGRWQVWDATRLAPRQSLVRITTGRDAADIAFCTVISGRLDLESLEINAVSGGDLPLDDHERLVTLA
ncbi:transglutaminase-like domain-containing protein [Micromonospora sp. NBC_01796]|uniref:transglutaminase-like domain-containing protein n=1 Tax=Micromonospora sp. NBC_01796 TaxID=2975987 RepID=UPI002DD7AEC5|nr:transglutaminase-like domain-containing protein [Micromonospora sp. NBC_01796]WSA83546.1 transglutaminase-like domain-containing protein [Micromonospora sp. NBC_01796]